MNPKSHANLASHVVADYLRSSTCDDVVKQFLSASLSKNTLRSYQSDITHFAAWGGTIPCSADLIARYVAHHANTHAVATLSRRVAAISRAHASIGEVSPTTTEIVRGTLRGIRRIKGSASKPVRALQKADLLRIVHPLTGMCGQRDKALLLIGFAGAFRRSELVALNVGDLNFSAKGLIIHLRRGKTDQEGYGRLVAIPRMTGRNCAVKSLENWLTKAAIAEGALFRRVDRTGQVLANRLSAQSVALIIKRRVAAVGIDARRYSGHSLRAGFATSAAQAGVSSANIRTQTGHQSDAMLQRYIRSAELFSANANNGIWAQSQ